MTIRSFVVVVVVALLFLGAPGASAQMVGNAACPGEDVFFNPSQGQDIFVPPGYKI